MKILLLVMGIILCSIGLSFLIIYLNLLGVGFSFGQYILYYIKNGDFLYLIGGLLCLFLALKK